MQQYLPDKNNDQHLKIARQVTIVMSFLILIMFLLVGIYFLKPISNYITEKYSSITNLVFKKSPEKILKSIRSDIIPSIVQVGCMDEKEDKEVAIGSGIFYFENGDRTKPMVQTNAHVILAEDGKYHGCNIYFPREDGSFYKSSYAGGDAFLYHDVVSVINGEKVNGIDLADIRVGKAYNDLSGVPYAFPPDAPDVFQNSNKICTTKTKPIEIGEKIYLIGYPNTGGNNITLTEGVVSGVVDGNPGMIKVSANTNHGNSGGIAIGQNDGCYYGVVNAATFETGSNLGIVISSGYIDEFLKNATDEKIKLFPEVVKGSSVARQEKSYLDFLTKEVDILDIKLRFPEEWQLATSSDSSLKYSVISIASPYEDALDIFKEGFLVEISDATSQRAIDDRIKLIKSGIEEIKGTNLEEGEVEFPGGVKALQISFVDESGKVYGAPAAILNTIFVYKGKVYLLTSLAGSSTTLKKYGNIFKTMLKTIEFN